MTDPLGTGRADRWLPVEAAAFGLAYGASLCWASVCLLGSFRADDMSAPYWNQIAGLRSDTAGVLAFLTVAASLSGSEFLRLRRRRIRSAASAKKAPAALADLAFAVSETLAVLGTGLVIYLSVNAVTHPVTLGMQATHFASWPTEGTLRVIALLLCTWSAGMLRYLRARGGDGRASTAQPVAEDMAAGTGWTAGLGPRSDRVPRG